MAAAFLAKAEDKTERNAHSVCMSFCGMGSLTVEVKIPASKHRECVNSLAIPSNYHTAIIDSGFDTCIIGKRWQVVQEDPIRRVRVIGFDKELTTKSNLPIVSTMIIVELPTHRNPSFFK